MSRRRALLFAAGLAVGGVGIVATAGSADLAGNPARGTPRTGSTDGAPTDEVPTDGVATGDAPTDERPAADLDERVLAFTGDLTPSMAYRPPDDAERAAAVGALVALAADPRDAGAATRLAGLGLTSRVDADRRGLRYLLCRSDPDSDRSWGLFALPIDRPVRVLVEVPHPRADIDTEAVGLDLAAALDGAALVVAGAHRRADDGRADVAHHPDSLFQAATAELASRTGAPQVQLHGFDEDTEPGVDVVVSAGAGRPGPLVLGIADALGRQGFSVCRSWTGDCRALAARTNVQGLLAAERGLPFLHLEMSPDLRSRGRRRDALVAALVGAVVGAVG